MVISKKLLPYKKLLSNFLSLSFLQVTNLILPLITLPYLVKILGVEKYGLVMFAQAFIQYFVLFTDYGFNLSGTKEVARNSDSIKKLSSIFIHIQLIKIGLAIISFLLLLFIVMIIPRFLVDWDLYLITFGFVLGNVIFPIWFFLGIEEMKYITVLNFIAKIFITIGIFTMIKGPQDYLLVPFLNTLGQISVGIIALYLIFKKYKIRIIIPEFKLLQYYLKDGAFIFLSNISVSLYTVSNTFILGILTNNILVGYYSAAEKLITTINSLINPISQTLFPYINKVIEESKERGMKLIKKIIAIVFVLFFIGSLLILLLSDFIILTFYSDEFLNSIIILKILAFVPMFVSLSNLLGTQILIPLGRNRAFSFIIIIASAFNIILAFILVPIYTYIGTAIGVLISEFIVVLLMTTYIKKKGLLKLK